MKRVGYVMDLIAEYPNLLEAFWKAARGKRQRSEVIQFQSRLAKNLASLRRDLLEQRLTLGNFHRFIVRDPKVRIIHAASFRERVLHHAIMNVVGAEFERGAIDQSYACRKDKGNRAALAQALKNTTATGWFLKMDIRRYFDSIDHNILCKRFRRLFKDPCLLRLLNKIVASYELTSGRGLPIGTLTSQYFANFYLDSLDRFVKEELGCSRYVRFMDDFVLWDNDAMILAEWQRRVEAWLAEHLLLSVKEGTRRGQSVNGLSFLGFRIKPRRILLGRRTRKRFRRRLLEVQMAYSRREISERDLQRRTDALLAFVNQASCLRWRKRVIKEMERCHVF